MATSVKTASGTRKAVSRERGWPKTVKTFHATRAAEDGSRRNGDELARAVYIQRTVSKRVSVEFAAGRLVDDKALSQICSYYSLAAAQMLLAELSTADQRRLPRYPVPVARLARLAVASQEQAHGLGEALLQDAVKRCLALPSELGIQALLVDALHERAAAFYRQYGFREVAEHSLALYLPLGKR